MSTERVKVTGDHGLRLVEAGAILTSEVGGEGVDVVTARAYAHPALEGRAVVQLVPRGLGQAEDLAMEFLGFAAAADPVEVGTGRRQALGFPAWALIHDPANGHHALALVKDLERLNRLARSKPGSAKDGFEELAARLGTSVPHFLPTFYEQAGRAFMATDNKQQAAVMFGRAREAEQVHALAVDEDRQRDVFLEFAFGGALSAKALTQHARDLALRADPERAYELFLRICLERVAGGLPPYTGMADDLRRLARAAGLKAAEQDDRVVAALLETPALTRAPLGFWRAYTASITRLGRAEAGIRGQLLAMFPGQEQEGMEELWFDLLEATGAVEGLTEVAEREGLVRPRDGAVGWLGRAATWRARGWRSTRRSPRLLALVQQMADRLRAEARPLMVEPDSRGWHLDLDLTDLCLSLGLEVRITARRQLPIDSWMRDPTPGRRDLVALCAQAWAQPLLQAGLDAALRSSHYVMERRPVLPLTQLRPLLENAGPRQALGTWLRRIVADVEGGALPAMRSALDRLAAVAHAAVLAVEPRAVAALKAADPGRALARTLRIGLLDEFGWPALEEAVPQFPQPTANGQPVWGDPFELRGAWPGVVLANEARAVAVGPGAILATHDIRYPAEHRPDTASYRATTVAEFVDGQFLIIWRTAAGKAMAYWSGQPGEVFEIGFSALVSRVDNRAVSFPLPTGGRTTGGRPLVAGAHALAVQQAVAGDGVAWYRHEDKGWREFDPATGDGGRFTLPAFFEAGLDSAGDELDHLVSVLAPAPEGLEQSPLGTAGGLVGWRTVRRADGALTGRSVTGAELALTPAQAERLGAYRPAGVLRRPDGSEIGILAHHTGVAFWDGECIGSEYVRGRHGATYSGGTPYVPPLMWWHALRPRDRAGSTALRAVTDQQGRRLVASGRPGLAKILPRVAHPGLVAGVASAVDVAQECATSLAAVLHEAAQSGEVVAPEQPPAATGVDDGQLAEALAGLTTRNGRFQSWYHASPEPGAAGTFGIIPAACERVAHVPRAGFLARLTGAQPAGPAADLPAGTVDWLSVVGGLGALALRAASAATPEADRRALVALLEVVARTPLAEADGRWRVVELHGETKQSSSIRAVADERGPGHVIRTGDGALVVLHVTERWVGTGQTVRVSTALEHSAAGRFGAVPGYTVGAARVHTGWGGLAPVRELLDLIATRGPAPWHPGAVERLSGLTGMTRGEAALLLGGLPRLDSTLHNFLDPGTREVLGLKVAEAGTARSALYRALDPRNRLALTSLALSARPADLWEHGPAVEKVAEAWVAAFGRRVAVPEELVAEADSSLRNSGLPVTDLIAGLAAPENCRWLTTDDTFTVQDHQLVVQGTGGGGLDGARLVAALTGLLWLAHRLPLESPLRAALPRAFTALRERLRNPGLLVTALAGHDLGGIRSAYGHPRPEANAHGVRPAGTFPLGEVGLVVDRGWSESLYLRPAALAGAQDPMLLAAEGLYDPTTAALRLAADPAVARLLEGGPAATGWAQDPLLTAPAVVTEVTAELGLDETAARMYLQVLALPDPTDKNVARWNGWAPAQVRRTAQALIDAKILVEGKRARAGRRAFLPGGWLDVKGPMLPIEVWKASLLGYLPDGRAPLGVSVPAGPAAELFTAAWARVRAGDGPALEELRTGRRR